jgi:hypothetical protein
MMVVMLMLMLMIMIVAAFMSVMSWLLQQCTNLRFFVIMSPVTMATVRMLMSLMILIHRLFALPVVMRTIMMPSVLIRVQNSHDIQIAAQPKDGSEQHIGRLINHRFVYHPLCSLNKQFSSNDPNDSYVQKSSERLHLVVTKCKMRRTDL